jgi:hypothetical protein
MTLWEKIKKSLGLFDDENVKSNFSAIKQDKNAGVKDTSLTKATELNYYPKSVAGKTSNPNMLHKDWSEHIKKNYNGNFDAFKKDFNLGKLPEGLKGHLHTHFAHKDLPSPDNNFNVPEDEVRSDKVKKLHEKGYKQHVERYVDLPSMEKWFGETKKKFKDHLELNDYKNASVADIKGMDFKHKENYKPEQLDYFKHALDEHKNALSVLMHIEDPGTVTSLDRKKTKFGGAEKTEIPETSNLYQTMVKPFLKSHSEIHEGGFDMEKLEDWFSKLHEKQKSNVKNKNHIYDTYSDNDSDNFKEATGKNIGDYKYQEYVDNPFSPDELLYRYKHKAEGHNLYTKNYYDNEGMAGEAPDEDNDSQKSMFSNLEGTTRSSSAIQNFLNKNKQKVSENFEEDTNFNPKDFKKYAEGSKLTDTPLEYLVTGHNKEKGTVDLANPYTHDLIPILNQIAAQMKKDPQHFSSKTDISSALKQLHSDLQTSNPESVHPEALEGGNYKTVAEHLKDISSNKGKYATLKEREFQKRIEDEAKKQGVDLGKGGPKEGVQRNLFESDDEFNDRFEKWKKDNPIYVKESKAWESVNKIKKEYDEYSKKHINTPEHEKAVKSLTEDVFNTANPNEEVDADRYINVHKQVQKLGKAINNRPGKGAKPEDWKKYNETMDKYLDARNILESMHPLFTPQKLKERKKDLLDLHKKYSDLHRWALTRDKTTMPLSELAVQGSKKKLKAHSWEEMSNVDTSTLKNAGISPNIIKYVADMHPELYEGNYDPERLSNEQQYLEVYRLAKSHALHQVQGNHNPLSLQTIQNFGLSSEPLDKEQLRQKLGLNSDYEKKKLEHLLNYGLQEGHFERKGKKYVLAPKQVETVVKKSLNKMFGELFNQKKKTEMPQSEPESNPNDEWFNEDFKNYSPAEPGIGSKFHRQHIKNVIGNFRKDTTDSEMADFDEQIQNMDQAELIEYRSQLMAMQRQFQTEIGVRELDDNTPTPHSDPEHRDYLYLEDLIDKKLNMLNGFMLDKILGENGGQEEQAA